LYLDKLKQQTLRHLLGNSEETDAFIDWLDGFVRGFMHKSSFYRREDIKPTSKKIRDDCKSAARSCDRAINKLQAIVHYISIRPSVSDAITDAIAVLQALNPALQNEQRRLSPSPGDKRTHPQRMFLQHLMSAYSQCFPERKISASPNCKFYEVAVLALGYVGHKATDIKDMLEQEIPRFDEIVEIAPPPVSTKSQGGRGPKKIATSARLPI